MKKDSIYFLTIDNNLSFQQSFKNYPVRVVVLIAQDNTYPTIMGFFEDIVFELKQDGEGVKAIINLKKGN